MALVRAAGTRSAGINPVYAHTLMVACSHPRHARLYARMVVEAADHRAITRHAVRLRQVAAADLARDGIDDTLAHHQALHTALDDLAHRWGEPRPAITPSPIHPNPPESPCPRVLNEEQTLIAALIMDPTPLDDIMRWLHPEDFIDQTHTVLYGCVTALVRRGETVDPLTVLWEAQRRGHLADDNLDPELVLNISASGVAGSSDYWARRVVRTALLRTAVVGARAVRALADNPTLSPRSLVCAAREALAPLDATRARWHTATRLPTKAPRRHAPGRLRPLPTARPPRV
ncbi:helicase DnaB [Embleya sp. NBC_00888]|uniref:DnaB-like helicase N-terminal domain-containing protein n=1 Tax=Embleya sp. NBC_00888 TaxID=2975960 RepID=UPI00386CB959|nr:helicase DnaB [Embleya sp. NBC_00888]